MINSKDNFIGHEPEAHEPEAHEIPSNETPVQIVYNEILKSKEELRSEKPFMVGISGPPGAGKTTLAQQLAQTFRAQFPQSNILIFSSDDLYLPSKQYEAMRRKDPNCVAHDLSKAQLVRDMHDTTEEKQFSLPVFDKATRDIKKDSSLKTGPFDLIIYEGIAAGYSQEGYQDISSNIDLQILIDASPDDCKAWRKAAG
jgi:uridine kinase